MIVHTQPLKSYGKANLGPGLTVWRRVKHTVDREDFPFVVRLVAALDNGRMVVESFTLERHAGGPPVTGEALRSVRVAQFLRDAVWDAAVDDLDEEVASLMQSDPATITAGGKTDEALKAVSLAYRLAFVRGDSPRHAVMEMLGVSRATATRWVTAAVERGLLDASVARRATEEEEH